MQKGINFKIYLSLSAALPIGNFYTWYGTYFKIRLRFEVVVVVVVVVVFVLYVYENKRTSKMSFLSIWSCLLFAGLKKPPRVLNLTSVYILWIKNEF